MEGYYVNAADKDNMYRDNRVMSLGNDFSSLSVLDNSISIADDGYLLLSYLNQRRQDKKYTRNNSTILDKKVKLVTSNDAYNPPAQSIKILINMLTRKSIQYINIMKC